MYAAEAYLPFTNYWSTHDGQLGQIVYLINNNNGIPHGYYIWSLTEAEHMVTLTPFMGCLGYLEIVETLQIKIFYDTRINYYTVDERLLGKTDWVDFDKNKQCLDRHGCSYTAYMVYFIDKFILTADLVHQSLESESLYKELRYCEHHSKSVKEGVAYTNVNSGTLKMMAKSFNWVIQYNLTRDFNIST